MSVDCELAQALKKKFRFLEKRVTFLEEKSKRDEKAIKKLKRKRKMDLEKLEKAIKELKTGNSNYNGNKSTQESVEPVDVKPEPEQSTTLIIQQVESHQNQNNEHLESINGGNEVISQNLGEQIIGGENGTEMSQEQEQEVFNSVENENTNGNVHESEICMSKIDSSLPKAGAKTGVISSKPKEPLKKSKICNFCSKSFRDISNLSGHMRTHTGEQVEQPFTCKICSESFSRSYSLKIHSRTHTVAQSGQEACEEPGVEGESSQEEFEDTTFDVKPNLIGIEMTGSTQNQNAQLDILKNDKTLTNQKLVGKSGARSSEKIQEIANSSCEKSVERVQRSKISQNQGKTQRVHQNVKTGGKSSKPKRKRNKAQICAFCSKSFMSFSNLSDHMRVHTMERPFKCQTCSKSFKVMGHLNRHNYVHTGGKSSKPKGPVKKTPICAFCSKSFDCFERLSRHMRVHTGERPFKCEICSKSFNEMGNLKRHGYIHKGEKPFSCSVCSKSFTQSTHLQYHMSIHKGTYSCSICSKKLGSKCSLKIHERTHTGERSYECTNCNKKFTLLSSLVRHRKKNLNCQQE